MATMNNLSNMGMYSFPPLTSALAYPPPQPPVVPSTSTVTSSIPVTTKTEPIRPSSASVKDSYYDMYGGDSNNDAETCSSTRSNASPESQDESLLIGPFSGDQYVDIAEQEKRKLERKRARNRLAATKCRQRKIQKINDLEKELREHQVISNERAQKLKDLESSVEKLRHIVHEHRNHGCPVPTSAK